MATAMIRVTCKMGGRLTAAPTAADTRAANMYWPSTPMLNRFIRKPIATAMPAKYNCVARLPVSTRAPRLLP